MSSDCPSPIWEYLELDGVVWYVPYASIVALCVRELLAGWASWLSRGRALGWSSRGGELWVNC
jgi:hypothetical protein